MNTDYTTSHFNYDNDFLHQFNIFKKNELTGVGTSNPTYKLDVNGTLAFSDNINIEGNINLVNKYPNHINLLEYNVNSHLITPLKLMNKEGTINSNKYEWSQENNNLMLKFYNKRDNTPIPFHSIEYTIKNTIDDKKLHLYSKYNIKITHLYIYTKNNDIFDSYTDFSILFKITLNNFEYTVTNKSEFYYELTSPIILNKNTSNIFELSGISTYPYNVILLGQYIFNEGILWNSNTQNVNIFSNIGIGTSIAQSELSIHGSSIIENLNISNIIIDNSNTPNLNIIYSNKLIINSNLKNVGIGTTNTNDFFNISNDFIVDHNDNTFLISKNNNIDNIFLNLPNNTISYKNKPTIIFNTNNTNNTNNIISKHIHISKPIDQNTTSNSCITQFLNNVNISNHNPNTFNNIFYSKGNTYINGNINVSKFLKCAGSLPIYIPANTIQNAHITSQTYVKNLIYSKHLNTQNIVTSLVIPQHTSTNSNKLCNVTYNPRNNRFYTKNNKYNIFLSSQNEHDKYDKHKFNYNFFTHAELLYTNNKIINALHIKARKTLTLPKKYTYPNNVDRTNIGKMRFDLNSMCPEIHTNTKWNKIRYSNEESEINFIAFDDIQLLEPEFKSHIKKYTYNSIDKPSQYSISINPNTTVEIHIQLYDNIIHSRTVNTTSVIIDTYSLKEFVVFNKIIIISTNTNTNSSISYTCNFNYYNPLISFLDKFTFVNIYLYKNSTNTYIIKPVTTLLNNYHKIALRSVQTNTEDILIKTSNNSLLLSYIHLEETYINIDDMNINYTLYKSNLKNSYYNRSEKKFYLGNIFKHYKHEIIYYNNNIIDFFQRPPRQSFIDISSIYEFQTPDITYNFNTKKMHIKLHTDNTTKEVTYHNNKIGCLYENILCKIKYNP